MGATTTTPPLAPPSALTTFLKTHPAPPASTPTAAAHHTLALQIAHNLHHQHNWTDVRLHTSVSLPRPLLSGLPSQKLYLHPDEQASLLQQQAAQGRTGLPPLGREREWVLPSHLREKWSLARFGEVFDAVGVAPQAGEGEGLFGGGEEEQKGDPEGEWRAKLPKRVLLATLEDDSTVVYYIVHDGVVKPRQN